MGALTQLDEFLLNLEARVHTGLVLGTSRNLSRENHGTNEDRSHIDLHPEVGVSMSQASNELSPGAIADSSDVSFGNRSKTMNFAASCTPLRASTQKKKSAAERTV